MEIASLAHPLYAVSKSHRRRPTRRVQTTGALNLFGGILVQKRRAERELEDSGLPYVIVRPGGMERPSDDYKLTNNVRLETRDRLFGGQVSRLQVAELITAAVSNPELAENKVTMTLQHFCVELIPNDLAEGSMICWCRCWRS